MCLTCSAHGTPPISTLPCSLSLYHQMQRQLRKRSLVPFYTAAAKKHGGSTLRGRFSSSKMKVTCTINLDFYLALVLKWRMHKMNYVHCFDLSTTVTKGVAWIVVQTESRLSIFAFEKLVLRGINPLNRSPAD